VTIALCALSFAVGFIVRAIIATPTRELPTTGPHTRLGQGDYTTDIFA
jgi:hypothetical protein